RRAVQPAARDRGVSERVRGDNRGRVMDTNAVLKRPETISRPDHTREWSDVRPIPGGKRALDVMLSAAGLLASAPLWAVLAAAIKLEDGGAVLFGQERVGEGGRVFRALKFRSMIPNAEAGVGGVSALGRDPPGTHLRR